MDGRDGGGQVNAETDIRRVGRIVADYVGPVYARAMAARVRQVAARHADAGLLDIAAALEFATAGDARAYLPELWENDRLAPLGVALYCDGAATGVETHQECRMDYNGHGYVCPVCEAVVKARRLPEDGGGR